MKTFIKIITNTTRKVLDFFGVDAKINHGSKRIAILFKKQGFAIKIPRIRIFEAIRCAWDARNNDEWSYIFFFCKSSPLYTTAYSLLFEGIFDNWRERQFSKDYGDHPFIVPTVFSFLGLINIMKLGLPLSRAVNMYYTIRLTENPELINALCKDSHHFMNGCNFVIYNNHIAIVDYGSLRTQEVVFRNFSTLNTLPISNEPAN